MTVDYTLKDMDLAKGREEVAFLNSAVLKVLNDCPNLYSHLDPYAIPYGSLEHKAYAEGKRRLSAAGLDTEAQIIAGLSHLTPEQKQAVLHRKIRAVISDGKYLATPGWHPITALADYEYWLLRNGLTRSQQRVLFDQILAYYKFRKYLASPQYAIDKITGLKNEALTRLTEIGESYR
jgi:hypothetical protein